MRCRRRAHESGGVGYVTVAGMHIVKRTGERGRVPGRYDWRGRVPGRYRRGRIVNDGCRTYRSPEERGWLGRTVRGCVFGLRLIIAIAKVHVIESLLGHVRRRGFCNGVGFDRLMVRKHDVVMEEAALGRLRQQCLGIRQIVAWRKRRR